MKCNSLERMKFYIRAEELRKLCLCQSSTVGVLITVEEFPQKKDSAIRMDIRNYFLYVPILALIWLNVLLYDASCGSPEIMDQIKAVKDKILKNYDRTVRPTFNGSNTTEVESRFIPRQILKLDEETAIFWLDSYYYMGWLDPRLRWNTSDYDGFLQLPRSLLWVPDITIFNSHSVQVDPTQEVLLLVHSSGQVWWTPPMLIQTSCPSISKTAYPKDEVECVVILGSWAHDGWEVDIQHGEDLLMSEFENINPRWELIVSKASIFRKVTRYECCSEPYISIHISFPMKRRPVPEIEATRTPCILIMVLALSIFWLPPDSSLKFLLCGLLFFALNILLVYVAGSTKSPLLVGYAVSFIQSAMYIIVTTLFLQVFIITKLCNQSGPSRPPPSVMQFLTGPLGKYACLRSPMSEDQVSLDRVQLKEDSSANEPPSAKDEWMLFAAALDRLFFLVMAIVVIAIHYL